MSSPYRASANNWTNTEQVYTARGSDSDPFFDPQSLTLSNTEFKPIPLPDDDFEPFLQKFSDIDNMLNDTLGYQELNIPNGYHRQEYFDQLNFEQNDMAKKHSRRISGSAIFGFVNGHSHQLSIPGIHATESSLKNGLIDYQNNHNMEQLGRFTSSVVNSYGEKEKDSAPTTERRTIESSQNSQDDFIITGKTPVAFKFPPTNHNDQDRLQERNLKSREESPNQLPQRKSFGKSYANDSKPEFIPPHYFEMHNNVSNSYSVEYINKLQQLAKTESYKNLEANEYEYEEENPFVNTRYDEGKDIMNSHGQFKEAKNNFYLLPPENNLGKPLKLTETNLEYSSPEEYFSSSNNSPILPQNLMISPQQNPPQLPELQTPQKMKLHPGPKLQPPSLMLTPTKFTMVTRNQGEIAELYNYDSGDCLTETPKKQMTGENEQVFWTPILITKDDPNSSKIIKDQLKKQVSVKRKETKITSTLPKGHLDQYFVGPDEDQKFTCTFNDCNKQFSRISNTRAHIQTHLSDRPFGCLHCSKRFVRHHDLRRHEKSHLEFSFECPCGKKFPRQDALKRHRIRKICCGAVENEKPVSPDKKLVSKPVKKKGKPKKEEELQDGLRDRILEELNYNTKGIDFEYLEADGDMDKSGNLLLKGMGTSGGQRNFKQDSSDIIDDFTYESFNM